VLLVKLLYTEDYPTVFYNRSQLLFKHLVKKYCWLKIHYLEVYWYHLYKWFPSVVFRDT